jgi:hypothetical protein
MSHTLSEPQQAKVQRIVTKIENFFSCSETLLSRTNKVTRWFVYIRESLGTNNDQSRWPLIGNMPTNHHGAFTEAKTTDISPTDSKQTLSSYHMDPLEALLPPGIGEISPL